MLNILVGLLGLGIVVFVHEFGHLLGAKACGIEVEAFSIGWGKKLFGFKWKGTEYCISLFPLGGYCKMKGEQGFQDALEKDAREIPKEPGSLYSVSPLKRIITYFAGPLGNLLFSIVIMAVVWIIGFNVYTSPNKIVMADDYAAGGQAQETVSPARRAGLQTGDEIVSIQGKAVQYFMDIQSGIAPNPDKELALQVRRNGEIMELTITPELNKDSGTGRIGIMNWVDPVIGEVKPGSAAEIAGLRQGDRILRAGGQPVIQGLDFSAALAKSPSRLDLEVRRGQEIFTTVLAPFRNTDGGAQEPETGFSFAVIEILSVERNPLKALAIGAKESFETLSLTVKSLGLLFKGINLRESLAGPLRITYMAGEVAQYGFAESPSQGFTSFFRFLSLISIALFFMNLLPIPMLDGGMIFYNLIELVRRKEIKPKYFYRFQMVGFFFLIVLILFSLFNDINFFVRR